MSDKDKLEYIANQITKAERSGWLDAVNWTNAVRCQDLLKDIRELARGDLDDR